MNVPAGAQAKLGNADGLKARATALVGVAKSIDEQLKDQGDSLPQDQVERFTNIVAELSEEAERLLTVAAQLHVEAESEQTLSAELAQIEEQVNEAKQRNQRWTEMIEKLFQPPEQDLAPSHPAFGVTAPTWGLLSPTLDVTVHEWRQTRAAYQLGVDEGDAENPRPAPRTPAPGRRIG